MSAASVFINDDESGLYHECDIWLDKPAPHAPTSQYHHNRTGEDRLTAQPGKQDYWYMSSYPKPIGWRRPD